MRLALVSLLLLLVVRDIAWAGDRLPAYLVNLPATVGVVYVAETSAAAFRQFDNMAGKITAAKREVYMSIGENGVGKQRAGDRRTPLGIYFVTEKLDTTRMHEKYGPMAFPLGYPNALDKRAERTGDGIWIHGVDARGGMRPARSTDGCIALPNDELEDLAGTFVANVTPVIIARHVEWATPQELAALRRELEASLAAWSDSLRRGDVYTHASLYDEEFQRWGMNKTEWTALLLVTVGARPVDEVEISDVLLLGDPQERGVYLSRFRQLVTENKGTEEERTIESVRQIYWRRAESGAFRIIAEDAG